MIVLRDLVFSGTEEFDRIKRKYPNAEIKVEKDGKTVYDSTKVRAKKSAGKSQDYEKVVRKYYPDADVKVKKSRNGKRVKIDVSNKKTKTAGVSGKTLAALTAAGVGGALLYNHYKNKNK